jgi:hypothetical protein
MVEDEAGDDVLSLGEGQLLARGDALPRRKITQAALQRAAGVLGDSLPGQPLNQVAVDRRQAFARPDDRGQI